MPGTFLPWKENLPFHVRVGVCFRDAFIFFPCSVNSVGKVLVIRSLDVIPYSSPGYIPTYSTPVVLCAIGPSLGVSDYLDFHS